MPVFSTWGFKVISVLAERLFVKRLPLVTGEGRPVGASICAVPNALRNDQRVTRSS